MEEGLAELLGYGPLAELFRDPSVREVMVAGPTTVLARRDTAGWVPTTARFANDEHLRESLDRLATHADPVGPVTASVHHFRSQAPQRLPAVAVIPPEPVGRSPYVSFVRIEVNLPAIVAGRRHCLGSVAQHHHDAHPESDRSPISANRPRAAALGRCHRAAAAPDFARRRTRERCRRRAPRVSRR